MSTLTMTPDHTAPTLTGVRPRAPRATLRFRRFFSGEEKGSHKKTIALTTMAIVSHVRKHMGSGWGCRVVLTREQIAAVGGWQTASGFALAHDFDFVDVEGAYAPSTTLAATTTKE